MWAKFLGNFDTKACLPSQHRPPGDRNEQSSRASHATPAKSGAQSPSLAHHARTVLWMTFLAKLRAESNVGELASLVAIVFGADALEK
jgi:hypothetical protein